MMGPFMLIQFQDCQETRWKNGLGSTFQRFIQPVGASLEDFDIRVSMARVQSSGPFSIFPDIDRQLCILEGDGLRLYSPEQLSVELTPQSKAYAFEGERVIESELLGQSVLDFNVMVRRGRFQSAIEQCELTSGMLAPANGELILILFLAPTSYLDAKGHRHPIAKYDVLMVEPDMAMRIWIAQTVDVILTRFRQIS